MGVLLVSLFTFFTRIKKRSENAIFLDVVRSPEITNASLNPIDHFIVRGLSNT